MLQELVDILVGRPIEQDDDCDDDENDDECDVVTSVNIEERVSESSSDEDL